MKDPVKQAAGREGSTSRKTRPLLTAIVCAAMLGTAVAAGLGIRWIRALPVVEEPVAQTIQAPEPVKVADATPQPSEALPEEPPAVVESPQPEAIQPQPQQVRPRMAGPAGRWGLEAFNLTEEEQASLRQGFAAIFQRFQSMTEEERQSQMARLSGLRERFDSMSDEEKQRAVRRVQQQMEQWQQSGGAVDDLINSLSLD
jgi:hypothetical protein